MANARSKRSASPGGESWVRALTVVPFDEGWLLNLQHLYELGHELRRRLAAWIPLSPRPPTSAMRRILREGGLVHHREHLEIPFTKHICMQSRQGCSGLVDYFGNQTQAVARSSRRIQQDDF